MTAKITRPWWVVSIAGLAIFMAMLDASIVTVAVPSIQSDLARRGQQ